VDVGKKPAKKLNAGLETEDHPLKYTLIDPKPLETTFEPVPLFTIGPPVKNEVQADPFQTLPAVAEVHAVPFHTFIAVDVCQVDPSQILSAITSP